MEKTEKEILMYNELPKRVKNIIEESIENVSQEEKGELHNIFSRSKVRIQDILHEYGYSDKDIAQISDGVLDYYEKRIQATAYDKRRESLTNSSNIASGMTKSEMEKVEEVQNVEAKEFALKKSYNNIAGYSQDIINDGNLEARRRFERASEDMILTELKYEIKKRINPYDSRNAEEAFSEISGELSRRLIGDIEQVFYDNSRDISKIVTSKIQECIHEFDVEYKKLTEKEEVNRENDKSSEKSKFKESLSEGVKSFEEVMEEYNTKNVDKVKESLQKDSKEEFPMDRFF